MSNKRDLEQHRNLVSTIRIDHEAYESALNAIGKALSRVGKSAIPIFVLLIGESRTGKSCVTDDFLSEHLPTHNDGSLRQTVVHCVVPPGCTVKGLVSRLLRALNDPLWDRGSLQNMMRRLENYLDSVGCKMVILDEFQHIAESGNQRLHKTADYIKNLFPDNRRALIAVGMPNSVAVVRSNEQLRERFRPPLKMPLFTWRDETSRAQFIALLHSFREQLVPFEFPDLSHPDMAFRMLLASSGRVGHVVAILDEAINRAIDKNTTVVNVEGLSKAFDEAVWFAPSFPIAGGPFAFRLAGLDLDTVESRVRHVAHSERNTDESGEVKIRDIGTGQALERLSAKKARKRSAELEDAI